jgi:hypothetical protein
MLGGAVQLGGDLLVRLGGSRGPVPGAAADVVASRAAGARGTAVHGIGDRAVHGEPLADRRGLVDRRPDQRMPEHQGRADCAAQGRRPRGTPRQAHQPGPLGRREVRLGCAQGPPGPEDQA